MSEQITFARPYARAVFELAQAERRIDPWRRALQTLAALVRMPEIHELIGNPHVTPIELSQVLIDAAAGDFDAEAANLARLLAENSRLDAALDLAAYFETLYDAATGTVEAEAVSARPLDDTQRETLIKALAKRLGKQVTLRTREDPTLLAGVIVQAGDLVIDGSLKGRLGQMARAMSR